MLKGKLASPRFMVKLFSLYSWLSDYVRVPMALDFRYCLPYKRGFDCVFSLLESGVTAESCGFAVEVIMIILPFYCHTYGYL